MAAEMSKIGTNLPHVRVLGTMSISRPGTAPDELSGGTATVLAALVAARGRGVSHREIAELYWPSTRPEHWRGLISFYRRWLQQRLPTGWSIDGTEELTLFVGEGWVDAWHLTDNDPREFAADDVSTFAGTPYPGVTRRGIIGESADLLQRRQDLLSGADSGSAHCELHRERAASAPQLIDGKRRVLITNSTESSPAIDALRMRLEQDNSARDHLVHAGAGSSAHFGDMAVALAAVRWALLDVQGESDQAQLALAWRIVRDHMQAGSPVGDGRLIVFDAHQLDDWSLRLLEQIIRYPFSHAARVVIIGDPTSERPLWRQLLGHVTDAAYTHITLCDMCAPWTMSAMQLGTWAQNSPEPHPCR